ncbi:MAG: serine hydrolase [Burkholderiales bacterium]|nr:serine hydrolase [Burkholderiales bacterium]
MGAAPSWAQRAGAAVAPPASDPALAARHQHAFAGLAARIDASLGDVQSVLVRHRGQLAFDYYRSGIGVDTLQDVQSVTKSVLALLFGQAMADGHVRGPDELVALRLPALLRLGLDARVQRLRFAHLLTMTAGWPGDETARRDRDDDLRWLARRPFVAEPGARFAYDNGAANLLALALAQAVGEPLADYARRRLFQPLGIERFDWRRGAQGHALGAIGLSLATPAMARLGELVLAEGQWQGRALVPRAYMRALGQRHNAGGPPLGAAYGYLWWLGAGSLMASGYGGQWIHVEPALQLVVAVTSRRTPESAARGQGRTLIRRDIVPAVRRLPRAGQ